MAKASSSGKISRAEVRMYCMGTGDCFVIKFYRGAKKVPSFTMMIDCGVWSGEKAHLKKYMDNLIEHVGDRGVDLLVVTHEHKDHVQVFESCKELFTGPGFKVKKIWMAWTENDAASKIKKWKTQYGEKKKSLAMAAEKLEELLNDPVEQASIKTAQNGFRMLGARLNFSKALTSFKDLHVQGVKGNYKGSLEGMRIVKQEIGNGNIEYFSPGDIIDDVPELDGVRFYVLGPPEKYDDVKRESGKKGESYEHNDILRKSGAFSAAVENSLGASGQGNILPFEEDYELQNPAANTKGQYENPSESWRKIEYDWLYSAGSLALRMNSLTNNLSLALAIEFVDSGRVMLFPGDAEYGSWASWHNIDWKDLKGPSGEHWTKDLLRRTVFYKVAHHMSHNGTAKQIGMDLMTHKDLCAMATLDYNVIAPGWTSTMPNRALLQQLLTATKGRLLILNEDKLFADFKDKEPIHEKILEARKKMSDQEADAFKKAVVVDPGKLFIEFNVKA
jgi:hypothetical protein